MKKHILVVCFLTLSAWLGACKKQDVVHDCDQVEKAPQEFLDYWSFPPGSYWVYKQRGSVPAVFDTVRGGTQTRVFKPGQATYGLPTCVTLYEAHFTHSNRTFFRGYSSLQNFAGGESLFCQGSGNEWGVQQSNEAGNIYSTGLILVYPLPPPGTMLSRLGPTLLDTVPVTVPAGRFPHSLHFGTAFIDSTTSGINFLRRFHLARGVGYTRKVYTRIGTWELVAYKINP
ncbi:hypothetical protein [Hymenobacter swuensis]|uniref:Lipoprotein n=1 Tax=Hymenobacter swuensis DY53 TaxID=1227739 RepID=W8EUP1_9BACT|nr:hypothetical protein [Hymenobacter swuensis]AHJ95452.1 hypothetical protein Hsw_PA0119 [Hymenobacter swuensis DY53]